MSTARGAVNITRMIERESTGLRHTGLIDCRTRRSPYHLLAFPCQSVGSFPFASTAN